MYKPGCCKSQQFPVGQEPLCNGSSLENRPVAEEFSGGAVQRQRLEDREIQLGWAFPALSAFSLCNWQVKNEFGGEERSLEDGLDELTIDLPFVVYPVSGNKKDEKGV